MAHATRVAAAGLLAFAFGSGAVPAQDDPTSTLLRAMTDYLASQDSLAFSYDSSLDVITTEGQKLTLAASGEVHLARPDRFAATRQGGFADATMTFDGQTLTLVGNLANVYAEIDAPGSFDELVSTLKDSYGAPLPAVDLLTSDAFDALTTGVTEARDLGSGVIGGVECDHLAYRAGEVDWQIWIAQGDTPYPCRYAITARDVEGWPSYVVDVRNWRTGADAAAAFAAIIPEGAAKIEPNDLADLDEAGGIYAPAGGN